jgi:hypothetical protein
MEKMVTWRYLHHHHIVIPPTYFSITFQTASKQWYPSTPSSKDHEQSPSLFLEA